MGDTKRMRWYNPKLEDWEWREVPGSDEETLALFEGSPKAQVCARVYREWRDIGASIMASLIRAGEAAHDMGKENYGGEEGS